MLFTLGHDTRAECAMHSAQPAAERRWSNRRTITDATRGLWSKCAVCSMKGGEQKADLTFGGCRFATPPPLSFSRASDVNDAHLPGPETREGRWEDTQNSGPPICFCWNKHTAPIQAPPLYSGSLLRRLASAHHGSGGLPRCRREANDKVAALDERALWQAPPVAPLGAAIALRRTPAQQSPELAHGRPLPDQNRV